MKHWLRVFSLLLLSAASVRAAQPDRITAAIDSQRTVILKGSVHANVQPQYDQGPVDPAMKLGYITLLIQRSEAQQAALDQLLAEQQDSSSANYQHWLSPEQYAERFGLSGRDISKITAWLRSQNFTVVEIARARNWIAFSGTAAQVQRAFHTPIHRYKVDGELHIANATEPAIPQALAGVVAGFRGLNDFRWLPMAVGRTCSDAALPSIKSDYSTCGSNYLAPDDIATIYDIAALYQAGTPINGSGQKLVIVGQTDIVMSDITSFRSKFNLPAKNPQVINLPGHKVSNNDLLEADLDLEWSGAVARNATIIYVNSPASSGGVFNSAQYAIDNKLAPVISMSYGGCEPQNGSVNALQVQALAQQANSEGITFFASSGDSGAAGCDPANSLQAQHGLAVNIPASVPEVTGLGGTEFDEGGGSYWGSNGANSGSALSYIPEMGWDDSSAGTGLASGLASTGGGKSIYFAKPSWQVGPGVPNDSARDVPDVSLTASADHDGYMLCSSGSCGGGGFDIVGGTSASTPVFAGIVTLLNQFLVLNGIEKNGAGLSNINPTLYQFAQKNSSAFHDVKSGSNIVPCQQNTPNCPQTAPFEFGYRAGTGYDRVTGLGSVDAYNLVTGWSTALGIPTTTTGTASPASVKAGTTTPVTLKATVTHASGNGTPTGTVTFYNKGTKVGTGTLSGGAASFSYDVSSLTGGTYDITATYSGDGNFAGSTSLKTSLNVEDFGVTANPTTVTVSAPGQSATTTLSIKDLGGFSGTFTYKCSGLPAETNCAFTSNAATIETLTITTTAASSQLREGPFGRRSALFYALLLPAIVGLSVPRGNRKRTFGRMRMLGLFSVLAVSILWMGGCGGGGSPSDPGTPKGSSNVTVAVTAADVTHRVTITLTVD